MFHGLLDLFLRGIFLALVVGRVPSAPGIAFVLFRVRFASIPSASFLLVATSESTQNQNAASVWHREGHHTQIHFQYICAETGPVVERENKASEKRISPNNAIVCVQTVSFCVFAGIAELIFS